jgi:iron complex transport system ATP-binding protein
MPKNLVLFSFSSPSVGVIDHPKCSHPVFAPLDPYVPSHILLLKLCTPILLLYLCNIMDTITIDNLSIGYNNKVIATGISATLCSGQLTALLGTNGVGKSTLLRTIAALQPALKGSIVFQNDKTGKRLGTHLSKSEMARLVSVVLTEQPDIHHFSVRDVVGMGRLPYTGFFGTLNANDRQIVAEALAVTGLDGFADRQFDALSDGERQKVMIAKALAQQTPIILLDEPTAFLDYPSKVEMMKMLRRLAGDMDKTILLSTHDLELASHYADRLLVFRQQLEDISKAQLENYMTTLSCHTPHST